jgi:hypothetical protein
LEVYNFGNTQTVIFNRAGGVVFFRQFGSDRRDSFSADLMPYLIRQRNNFPRYFIFMEPLYKTEYRLSLAMDINGDINFHRLMPGVEIDDVSIWTTPWSGSDSTEGGEADFRFNRNALSIEFEDYGKVLIPQGKAEIDFGGGYRGFERVIISIEDNTDLAGFDSRQDLSGIIFLFRRSIEEYPDIDKFAVNGRQSPEMVGIEDKSAYFFPDSGVVKNPY